MLEIKTVLLLPVFFGFLSIRVAVGVFNWWATLEFGRNYVNIELGIKISTSSIIWPMNKVKMFFVQGQRISVWFPNEIDINKLEGRELFKIFYLK